MLRPPSPLSPIPSPLPLLFLSSPQLYDLDRGEVVSVLSGHHKKGLYGVRFSKTQENLMGTVSSDHTVRATVVFVYTYLILVLFSFSSIQIVLPSTNIFMITIFVSFSSSAPISPPPRPPTNHTYQCCLWNVDSGEMVQKLSGHRDEVNGIAFHPTSEVREEDGDEGRDEGETQRQGQGESVEKARKESVERAQ